MKAYWGVDDRSNFFELGTQLEMSGQLHAPAALPEGKEPPVPIG
jgi:hypothetical protein